MLALQVAAFDEQVQCLCGAGDVSQAGYVHGGLIGQILELVGFVHKERVHAQVREVHGLVFLAGTGKQSFIAGFHFLALLFQLLDGGPSALRSL